MALHLGPLDVQHLVDLQETLLSPLDSPESGSWCDRIVESTATFFRTDGVVVSLSLDNDVIRRWSPPLETRRTVLERMIDALTTDEDRTRQWEPIAPPALRRASESPRLPTATVARPEAPHGRCMIRAFRSEASPPDGSFRGGAMSVVFPRGEAMVGVGAFTGDRVRPRPCGEWLDLLRLVLPAFRTGTQALLELRATVATLASHFDSLDIPLMVVDAHGREVHRSAAFSVLLRSETRGGPALLDAARRAGIRAAREDREGRGLACGREPERAPGVVRHELRAARLPAELAGRGDLAVVTVTPRRSLLPDPDTLRERFGLTPREAEVALILARGASNAQAAERLGISPHTVRTHTEHLFGKLGIRTRKALALNLASARR